MPKIGAGFDLQSSQPNFKRDQFNSISEMRDCTLKDIDQGHVSYCNETKRHYVFNKDGKNINDPTTGFWSLWSGSPTEPISMMQYLSMEHDNILYFITDSHDVLTRIYYGNTLIARKADSGEMMSVGFPMPIPFILP